MYDVKDSDVSAFVIIQTKKSKYEFTNEKRK
jgi:hypothetical protein